MKIDQATNKIIFTIFNQMLEELKLPAVKRDVPCQSLMKIILAERIEKELSSY